jgi:hypothetical protein
MAWVHPIPMTSMYKHIVLVNSVLRPTESTWAEYLQLARQPTDAQHPGMPPIGPLRCVEPPSFDVSNIMSYTRVADTPVTNTSVASISQRMYWMKPVIPISSSGKTSSVWTDTLAYQHNTADHHATALISRSLMLAHPSVSYLDLSIYDSLLIVLLGKTGEACPPPIQSYRTNAKSSRALGRAADIYQPPSSLASHRPIPAWLVAERR